MNGHNKRQGCDMKHSVYNRATLESIYIPNVTSYLIAQGWAVQDKLSDKAIFFSKTGQDQELLLPIRKDLADYTLRLSELLEYLSRIEERTPDLILNDIMSRSGEPIP